MERSNGEAMTLDELFAEVDALKGTYAENSLAQDLARRLRLAMEALDLLLADGATICDMCYEEGCTSGNMCPCRDDYDVTCHDIVYDRRQKARKLQAEIRGTPKADTETRGPSPEECGDYDENPDTD